MTQKDGTNKGDCGISIEESLNKRTAKVSSWLQPGGINKGSKLLSVISLRPLFALLCVKELEIQKRWNSWFSLLMALRQLLKMSTERNLSLKSRDLLSHKRLTCSRWNPIPKNFSRGLQKSASSTRIFSALKAMVQHDRQNKIQFQQQCRTTNPRLLSKRKRTH